MQLFITAFESVPDPRAENVRHDLGEILIIAFIAVLRGARGCAEMAQLGRVKLNFSGVSSSSGTAFRRAAGALRRTAFEAMISPCIGLNMAAVLRR